MKSFIQYSSYLFFSFFIVSCSLPKNDEWKSPADEALLSQLESALEKPGVSRDRRAQLFYLWGQELSVKAKQETLAEGSLDRAIGAFERVVDLDASLVSESRFNLEILWREKAQKEQQEKENEQDSQKPQDKDKQDSPDKKGQQDKQGEQDKQGQQDKSKDLSGLVREKEQGSALDEALKREMERRNEKQQVTPGSVLPVEKDW